MAHKQMLFHSAAREKILRGTAALPAHAIVADGVRNVVARAGASDRKRGLDRGLEITVEALRELPEDARKQPAAEDLGM